MNTHVLRLSGKILYIILIYNVGFFTLHIAITDPYIKEMNLSEFIKKLMIMTLVITISQGHRAYRPQKWRRNRGKPASGKRGHYMTFRDDLEQLKIAALTVIAERSAKQRLNRMRKITNSYKH